MYHTLCSRKKQGQCLHCRFLLRGENLTQSFLCAVKFKKQYSLGAVNSINFARIMFQITYYFYTYFKLFPKCDGEMSFSVPTGNFGDILAGYYAKRMGLPVRHLIIATNSNDILDRFFASGVYEKHPVLQTMSPVNLHVDSQSAWIE
jgi:threonine synthase